MDEQHSHFQMYASSTYSQVTTHIIVSTAMNDTASSPRRQQTLRLPASHSHRPSFCHSRAMSSFITPSSPSSDSAPSSPISVPSPNLASRPVRATRGRRLTDLHGEGDDDFWQQEFFTAAQDEEEEWEKGEGDDEEEDEVDSDFFESEDEDDDGEEEEVDDREGRAAKRRGYVDPRGRKATAKAAAAPRPRKAPASTAAAASSASVQSASLPSTGSASLSAAAAPSVALLSAIGATRKSSRAATISATSAAHAKQQKRLASLAASHRPKLSFPILTQAQQLEQARQTEIDNRASLQQLLRIEQEKRKVTLKRRKTKASTILYHSTLSLSTVSWSTLADVPLAFRDEEVEEERLMDMLRRASKRCAVTGERARYVMKDSGLGFRGVDEWRAMDEAQRQGQLLVDKTEGERMKAERERRREERKEREKERGRERRDKEKKEAAAGRRRDEEDEKEKDKADKVKDADKHEPDRARDREERKDKERHEKETSTGSSKKQSRKRTRGAAESESEEKEKAVDVGDEEAMAVEDSEPSKTSSPSSARGSKRAKSDKKSTTSKKSKKDS